MRCSGRHPDLRRKEGTWVMDFSNFIALCEIYRMLDFLFLFDGTRTAKEIIKAKVGNYSRCIKQFGFLKILKKKYFHLFMIFVSFCMLLFLFQFL